MLLDEVARQEGSPVVKMNSNSGIATASLGLMLVLFSAAPVWCTTLRAGAAKTEITPPPGLPMWGYSNRKGPATGTLDPLYARVLVLEAATKRLALVTVDLGRSFGPASLDWLRSATRDDVSFVVVAASHTHSGPVIRDEYPSGAPAWETSALKKIAQAISQARSHLTDARIGTGYGFALIGHNRLRVNPDGTVSWFERNLTEIPTAPVDGTVTVLRVDTAAGQPLAILVNYACHPVIFGSDNLQYSADFPGAMAATVEEAFDHRPLCFFLQGAPGDINPHFAVTPLEEDAVTIRDRTGQTLGREAVLIAKEIHTQTESQPDLNFAQELINVHLRWNSEKWREALLAVFGPAAGQTFPSRSGEEIQLPITIVLINKTIAILTMPGEPFVEFQLAWRERCPVRDALLVGYANGYDGYFPTIPSASLGGYGAANPATWVEIGAGDRMVDAGVISINRMLGRLRELPEDLWK
jgi:neutral/alkaline ceramidase-like enzyme